jgi:hypothetical protein
MKFKIKHLRKLIILSKKKLKKKFRNADRKLKKYIKWNNKISIKK